jgi:long-chain acyl-CoA synthetase
MEKENKLTLPALFQEAVSKHGERNALAFVGKAPLTYDETNRTIGALMAHLERLGVEPGDKVAILSSNMPNWGISYLAIVSMGAVVVPLLPDFHPNEVRNILYHSESKVVLVSEGLRSKVPAMEESFLQQVLKIEDFSLISGGEGLPAFDETAQPQGTYRIEEQDPASIIYTSGTTGKSKGVMLSHRNIAFTAEQVLNIQPVTAEDRMLSILPLSHTYENTLGLLLPLFNGASIYYLSKPPTPSILVPALKKVRPTLMLSVPMVIEKIYRNKILPGLTGKWHMRMLYSVPPIRKKLNQVAGKKLKDTFGGELKFFGIGGAKLDPRVERFLQEARFPYAIGYGLTETSPLLAGTNAQNTRLQSTGPAMNGVELKIHKPDPETGEGEIWARGDNVMMGYYKDPEKTREVLTEDGWFKTGDLGVFDKNNFLFIKGRLKNMIVGENGENIYPEEIESEINNFRHVVESLVVREKGKLVAMVHFNRDEIFQKYHELREEVHQYAEEKIEELSKELREYINSRVNRFSRIQHVLIQNEPFEKTATQKIKRYLYNRLNNRS